MFQSKVRIIAAPLLIAMLSLSCSPKKTYNTWSVYRGNVEGTAYSSLGQITTANVTNLELAWTYHTNEADTGHRTAIQCNPILADGKLFVTTPRLKLAALDPATGKELWRFDPFKDQPSTGVNRGVSYWSDGTDKRILFSAGPYLYCLRADNGKEVGSFGDSGKIDMRQGLGRDPERLTVSARTPGAIFKDIIIMGSTLGEGYDAAPGFIRAYDVHTGKTIWTFHTIPQPGETGYDTWTPNAYKEVGGTNCWTGMTIDEKRGIVFIPTGSAAFDFYGGNRKGKNLYANCLLAIDAASGKLLWHYQLVHHDLWDYDLPASPTLVVVKHNGKSVDAVSQITKMGMVFLFNRETGEPIFPIEERAVPRSGLLGEELWETQPFPVLPPPFSRQRFTPDDITDRSPKAHQSVVDRAKGYHMGPIFTPPSLDGVIQFPGTRGGGEWGGASVDPNGIMYVNANEIPVAIKMKAIDPSGKEYSPELRGWRLYALNNCGMCHGSDLEGNGSFPPLKNISKRLSSRQIESILSTGRGQMPPFPNLTTEDKQALIAYFAQDKVLRDIPTSLANDTSTHRYVHDGWNYLMDYEGYPGVKPPWGTLSAIDLNKGAILWQVPLGEYPELTAQGIPVTGTQNLGGPVSTAGGLIFIAATCDEKFRAIDKTSGKVLWEYKLPAGGYATPAVYEAEGKQYIIIAAGGGGIIGTRSGDSYLAFRLR